MRLKAENSEFLLQSFFSHSNSKIMINKIQDIPDNAVGFTAAGEVTKDDFQNVLVPSVESLIKRTGQINFLLFLDTDISNFTAGAWFQDILLGLKNLGKWNRAAIVTDSSTIISFTNAFSYVIPGEFKGFPKEHYAEAMAWVSENEELK